MSWAKWIVLFKFGSLDAWDNLLSEDAILVACDLDLGEWAIASHGKDTCPLMEVANVDSSYIFHSISSYRMAMILILRENAPV